MSRRPHRHRRRRLVRLLMLAIFVIAALALVIALIDAMYVAPPHTRRHYSADR